MKLTQLKALIKRGESEVLEFKTSTGSLDSAMKTVCAFLNSDHGGTELAKLKKIGLIKAVGKTKSTIWMLSDYEMITK